MAMLGVFRSGSADSAAAAEVTMTIDGAGMVRKGRPRIDANELNWFS